MYVTQANKNINYEFDKFAVTDPDQEVTNYSLNGTNGEQIIPSKRGIEFKNVV